MFPPSPLKPNKFSTKKLIEIFFQIKVEDSPKLKFYVCETLFDFRINSLIPEHKPSNSFCYGRMDTDYLKNQIWKYKNVDISFLNQKIGDFSSIGNFIKHYGSSSVSTNSGKAFMIFRRNSPYKTGLYERKRKYSREEFLPLFFMKKVQNEILFYQFDLSESQLIECSETTPPNNFIYSFSLNNGYVFFHAEKETKIYFFNVIKLIKSSLPNNSHILSIKASDFHYFFHAQGSDRGFLKEYFTEAIGEYNFYSGSWRYLNIKTEKESKR